MDAGESVDKNGLYMSMKAKNNLFPYQLSSTENFGYTFQWQLLTLPAHGENNIEKTGDQSARRGSHSTGRYALVFSGASR